MRRTRWGKISMKTNWTSRMHGEDTECILFDGPWEAQQHDFY